MCSSLSNVMFLFTFFITFFFKVTHVLCVPMFPQGYAEGSHYSEHEGLSSPFISSGVAGMFSVFWLTLNNFKVTLKW